MPDQLIQSHGANMASYNVQEGGQADFADRPAPDEPWQFVAAYGPDGNPSPPPPVPHEALSRPEDGPDHHGPGQLGL